MSKPRGKGDEYLLGRRASPVPTTAPSSVRHTRALRSRRTVQSHARETERSQRDLGYGETVLYSVTARDRPKARHTVRARFVTGARSMTTVKALLQTLPTPSCVRTLSRGPRCSSVWPGGESCARHGRAGGSVLRVALGCLPSAPRCGWPRRWLCHSRATPDLPQFHASLLMPRVLKQFCLGGPAEASKGDGAGPAPGVRVGQCCVVLGRTWCLLPF